MFLKESCIMEIYTKSTESFSVGRVFCQNEDCVVFEDIDVQGKITGYRVMKKSSISQLQYDTEYLDKISKYMEFAQKHSYANWFSLKHVSLNTEGSLILQILQYAKTHHIIITVEAAGMKEPEAGYIEEINHEKSHENITLTCIDVSNARLAEKISIAIGEIVFIEFESIDNLLLKYALNT